MKNMISFNLIYERRSIRKFQQKDVPTELLNKVLDAGRVAPSAKNRQPWKYIVFGNEQLACAIAIGYANENPNPRPRKLLDEIVEYRL